VTGGPIGSWPDAVVEVAKRCRFTDDHAGGPLDGHRDGHIDCAVSGGADSLALVALALCDGHDVTAWHVRHGLRPTEETADEPDRIEAMLGPLGVQLRVVDVALGSAEGNVEERAREARYRALPSNVAVGHTADDVAETVIANLIRGSGLGGLAPMRSAKGPARPLIALRRADTEQVCAALGWTPIVDSMNSDSRFLRVRIRNEVLPLLNEIAGRDVSALLARLASVTADDIAVLDAMAAELDPTDAKAVRQADPALARRAIRNWLTREAGDGLGHPPDFATVERVLAVARNDTLGTEAGGGFRVVRRAGGRLVVVRPPEE
jgi:tRNA(Ile)-lysidine synthase